MITLATIEEMTMREKRDAKQLDALPRNQNISHDDYQNFGETVRRYVRKASIISRLVGIELVFGLIRWSLVRDFLGQVATRLGLLTEENQSSTSVTE